MPNTSRVETADYAAMLTRMVRGYGRRLATGDPTDLAAALELARQLDLQIGQAVSAMRAQHGFSWAEVADALGTTRQAAQQRYGRFCA